MAIVPGWIVAGEAAAGRGAGAAGASFGSLSSPLAARLAAEGLVLPPAWPEQAGAAASWSLPSRGAADVPAQLLAGARLPGGIGTADDYGAGGAGVDGRVSPPPGPETAASMADATLPPAPDVAAGKVRRSRQLVVGALVAWGLLQWDYGRRSPHLARERWFQADTAEGGADKLGHFYTAQALARGMASLYRGWGLAPAAAAREGARTSVLVTAVMEAGDGFSPYGVSGEDMVMNLAGAWAGLELARRPAWRERVDVRVEYRFGSDTQDISTDYERGRFLVALKPAGFAGWRDTPLRWLELQLGYYARGYDQPLTPDRRVPYAALGLNLPLLFRRAGLPRLAGVLQFYQPPDSSLRVEDPR